MNMDKEIWQTLYHALMVRAEDCMKEHAIHLQNEEYRKARYWATQLAEAEKALEWICENIDIRS